MMPVGDSLHNKASQPVNISQHVVKIISSRGRGRVYASGGVAIYFRRAGTQGGSPDSD
jgi:hypothetical protein